MGRILESISNMLLEEQKSAEQKILGNLPNFEAYQRSLGKLDSIKNISYKVNEIISTYMKAQDNDY